MLMSFMVILFVFSCWRCDLARSLKPSLPTPVRRVSGLVEPAGQVTGMQHPAPSIKMTTEPQRHVNYNIQSSTFPQTCRITSQL
jgi:hypothetical protein